MGETEKPNFYDFGIGGRVPEPQTQLFSYFETPECVKYVKKAPKSLLDIQHFEIV